MGVSGRGSRGPGQGMTQCQPGRLQSLSEEVLSQQRALGAKKANGILGRIKCGQ